MDWKDSNCSFQIQSRKTGLFTRLPNICLIILTTEGTACYAHLIELNCCCCFRSTEALFPWSHKNGKNYPSATIFCHSVVYRSACGLEEDGLCFCVKNDLLPNAHGYADDHQIYLSFTPANQTSQEEALHVTQNCVNDVRKWMLVNKLKINDSKTEFLIIGSKHQLSKITIDSIKIGDSEIKPVASVKNLGVLIDNNLSMESHITKTCSIAFYHIYNIKHIRKYLTRDLTEKIVHALITSKLDYCNSLLFGLLNYQLQKLQRVQNAAARIIAGTRKYDRITPVLRELHWLPVKERIDFKVLLLTFKALNNMAPAYLKGMLRFQTSDRYKLRSEKSGALIVPRTKFTSRGDRAFCTAAPKLWNKLPVEIRRSQSVHAFKTRLKTHLFDNYFNI